MVKVAAKLHRGRFQAQGSGVEESCPWGLDAPLPAASGHQLLRDLANKLTERERGFREEAFGQAHGFVDRGAELGGVPQDARYPMKKSYPQPPRLDERRVDIEVHSGRAFVPNVVGAP